MGMASPTAELIIVLAIAQFFWFLTAVGNARRRYGIRAPATTGHDVFERYFRVQMNTLELLVMFIPLVWMTRAHLGPLWIASLGTLYLLGRVIYFISYVRDPASRGLGYALSALSIAAMICIVVYNALRALFSGVY